MGGCDGTYTNHALDWVIAGGESGPGSRPSHPDWFRSLRDQCRAARVPFFFKSWGDWVGAESLWESATLQNGEYALNQNKNRIARVFYFGAGYYSERVGKKRSGRLLDGEEWNQFPT